MEEIIYQPIENIIELSNTCPINYQPVNEGINEAATATDMNTEIVIEEAVANILHYDATVPTTAENKELYLDEEHINIHRVENGCRFNILCRI